MDLVPPGGPATRSASSSAPTTARKNVIEVNHGTTAQDAGYEPAELMVSDKEEEIAGKSTKTADDMYAALGFGDIAPDRPAEPVYRRHP